MTDFEKAERVWEAVAEKIRPAVMEMAVRADSGKIIVHFGSGDLKFSTKECTL